MQARSGEMRGRVKRRHPEDDLQMQAARFLEQALPSDAVWFHVPNGGKRNRREAARFKAMGVKAGVLDIAVFYYRITGGQYLTPICVWFELKAPGMARRPSAVSAEQYAMIAKLKAVGHHVFVVDTLDAIEAGLREVGIPLRATLGRLAS